MNAPKPTRGVVDNSSAPRVRLGAWTRRIFIGAVVCGIAVWLVLWAADEGPNPPSPATRTASSQVEDLQSFLVRADDGVTPLWEISAARVETSPDGATTFLRQVSRGTLFRQGTAFLTFSAPLVKISASKDLDASGGVRVQGPDGFSFQTERAKWSSRDKRVDCPQNALATLRGLRFTAPQLRYEWDKNLLSCPKPSRVDGEGFTLMPSRLRVNTKTRFIDLGGGSQAVFDPRRAKAPPLDDLVPLVKQP